MAPGICLLVVGIIGILTLLVIIGQVLAAGGVEAAIIKEDPDWVAEARKDPDAASWCLQW